MTRAYSEFYLNDAKRVLSQCFDYMINDCGFEADWVSTLFVSSGYARQFECGNPAILSGMSGTELATAIVRQTYEERPMPERRFDDDLSPGYWAGWVLAEYQWFSGKSFEKIFDRVALSEIILMYPLFHETDISVFLKEMEKKCVAHPSGTKLKKIRESRGLSQAELARESGVKLRNIQMYEQQINDIDKAQARTVYKLARAIGCEVEDLLEDPMK